MLLSAMYGSQTRNNATITARVLVRTATADGYVYSGSGCGTRCSKRANSKRMFRCLPECLLSADFSAAGINVKVIVDCTQGIRHGFLVGSLSLRKRTTVIMLERERGYVKSLQKAHLGIVRQTRLEENRTLFATRG